MDTLRTLRALWLRLGEVLFKRNFRLQHNRFWLDCWLWFNLRLGRWLDIQNSGIAR
jgi:hypothetical protein